MLPGRKNCYGKFPIIPKLNDNQFIISGITGKVQTPMTKPELEKLSETTKVNRLKLGTYAILRFRKYV